MSTFICTEYPVSSIKKESGLVTDLFLLFFLQKRYNFVEKNVELLAKKAGFEAESVIYIPISGWKGDNLVKRSENLNWFKVSIRNVFIFKSRLDFEPVIYGSRTL